MPFFSACRRDFDNRPLFPRPDANLFAVPSALDTPRDLLQNAITLARPTGPPRRVRRANKVNNGIAVWECKKFNKLT